MSKKKLLPGIDPSKLDHLQRYAVTTIRGREYLCEWNADSQRFWSYTTTSRIPLERVAKVCGPIHHDDIPWLMERTNDHEPQEATSRDV